MDWLGEVVASLLVPGFPGSRRQRRARKQQQELGLTTCHGRVVEGRHKGLNRTDWGYAKVKLSPGLVEGEWPWTPILVVAVDRTILRHHSWKEAWTEMLDGTQIARVTTRTAVLELVFPESQFDWALALLGADGATDDVDRAAPEAST